jgi:hypothetical protein
MTPTDEARERHAWELAYAAALTGYMSDPTIEPADDPAIVPRMAANCAEIADASLDEWRKRWSRMPATAPKMLPPR